jgi:hypothetical protein
MATDEKQGKPGRQHLITRTPDQLKLLIGGNSPVAVSQASLRKFIGSAGVQKLLAEDGKREK